MFDATAFVTDGDRSDAIYVAYRDLLVGLFVSEAALRRREAEEYPDDQRNLRSALALEAAAEYTRTLGVASETETLRIVLRCDQLAQFVSFDMALNNWVRGDCTPREVFQLGSARCVSWFFLDNRGNQPTTRDFDELINDTFDELVEDWKQSIEDGIHQPPDSLIAYFESCGHPLWEESDMADTTRPRRTATNAASRGWLRNPRNEKRPGFQRLSRRAVTGIEPPASRV